MSAKTLGIHADDMPPDGETVIYPVRKPPKQ